MSGDCNKSQALLDYILWTQTESAPIDAADQLGYSVRIRTLVVL
jgi:hypothetical protein